MRPYDAECRCSLPGGPGVRRSPRDGAASGGGVLLAYSTLGPDATVGANAPDLRVAFRLPLRAESGGSRTAWSSSGGSVSSTVPNCQLPHAAPTQTRRDHTEAVEVF